MSANRVVLASKLPGPPEPRPDYFVTVNGERGRIWQANVGTRTFPVTRKLPEASNFLGCVVMAYYVDMTRVDQRLRDRIERFLCERYNKTLDAVRLEIRTGGLPIIARNVTTPEGFEVGDQEL